MQDVGCTTTGALTGAKVVTVGEGAVTGGCATGADGGFGRWHTDTSGVHSVHA